MLACFLFVTFFIVNVKIIKKTLGCKKIAKMLDIEMVREPSRLQELIDNQQKRRKDVGIVNQVVEADQAWRNCKFSLVF